MASIWISQLGTICSSRTLLLLFSILLLRQPLCGQSSPISNTRQRNRPAPGLGDGNGGVVDPSLLEQDNNMNMQSLLQSLKEQFLRTFNLSSLGPPPLSPGGAREEPPEYMMELYNRFANDHSAMPTANIIRSFKNEGRSLCFTKRWKRQSFLSCCHGWLTFYSIFFIQVFFYMSTI